MCASPWLKLFRKGMYRTTTWAQLFGVPQNKDDGVPAEEHLADESISVDWLGALLALASLWDLQEDRLRSTQRASSTPCLTSQVLPARPCKTVAARVDNPNAWAGQHVQTKAQGI